MKLTAQVVVEVECTLDPNYTSLVDLKRDAVSESCNRLQKMFELDHVDAGIIKILGCQNVTLSIDSDLGTA
jgi:hypothetical protein